MVSGLERKAVVQDQLRGASVIKPVTLPSGGVRSAAPVRTPEASFDLGITRQVGQYLNGRIAASAERKHQRAIMDGQMAAYQGQTYEDVQMGGDKWALEGWRVVQAQQLSSGLLAAQQHEIETKGYELNPDQFREQFMGRVDEVLKGAPDQRTADLAREQLLKQMPTLVDTHTTAHLGWLEKQNFEGLEASIDIISRDPTAIDHLIQFAKGGEGTATAGLADDRRQGAVVSGVIRAFDNDNPLAFAALSKEGLLGDNLTTDQINAVRAARVRFENRRRQEYDEGLFTAETELMTRVQEGDLEPMAAVEELATLYAEHGITMNAQEAGAIYSQADQGVRTAAITRGALIDGARARGDNNAAADIIIQSLSGTESGGNAAAFRTNKDGRSFGGELQFGDARLKEVAGMLGMPALTATEFAKLPKADQQAINRMHIIDLMDQAQATGAIGKTINGVTVTMSGLVAVAHLGGAAGMRKFVSSNGEYNPSDELGTSLTDYLRKHASGDADHLYTPDQRRARAIATRDQVYQRTAAEREAAMRPGRDQDDALFRHGLIEEAEWRARNAERQRTYGAERTTAIIDHEASILSEVAVAGVERAADEQQRALALDFELAVEAQREAFADVAAGVSNGELPASALDAAAETFFAETAAAAERTGTDLSPNDILADVRKITAADAAAREANRKFHEDGVLIDQAIHSGTLGQLDSKLIDRAVRANEKALVQESAELVASGDVDPQEQPSWVGAQQRTFLAKAGVVDSRLKRVMNGYFAGGPIDREGNPNPEYVEAVNAYRDLALTNPALADKYVQPEHRSELDAILHNAGDGPVEGAVRAWGVRAADSAAEKDPDTFIMQPRIQKDIDSTVEDFFDEQDIGFLHSIWQGDADMSQMFDMTNTDRADIWSEDNTAAVRAEVRYELESAWRLNPRAKPSELVSAAARRVADRTTVIAGDVVMTPRGQPSLAERFFGAQTEFADQDGVYNTAIMDWLRSDGMREAYPYLNETSLREALPTWMPDWIRGEDTGTPTDQMNTWITGVRPFTIRTHPQTGEMYVEVSRPEGGYYAPIVVPQREVGDMYKLKHRKAVTGK